MDHLIWLASFGSGSFSISQLEEDKPSFLPEKENWWRSSSSNAAKTGFLKKNGIHLLGKFPRAFLSSTQTHSLTHTRGWECSFRWIISHASRGNGEEKENMKYCSVFSGTYIRTAAYRSGFEFERLRLEITTTLRFESWKMNVSPFTRSLPVLKPSASICLCCRLRLSASSKHRSIKSLETPPSIIGSSISIDISRCCCCCCCRLLLRRPLRLPLTSGADEEDSNAGAGCCCCCGGSKWINAKVSSAEIGGGVGGSSRFFPQVQGGEGGGGIKGMSSHSLDDIPNIPVTELAGRIRPSNWVSWGWCWCWWRCCNGSAGLWPRLWSTVEDDRGRVCFCFNEGVSPATFLCFCCFSHLAWLARLALTTDNGDCDLLSSMVTTVDLRLTRCRCSPLSPPSLWEKLSDRLSWYCCFLFSDSIFCCLCCCIWRCSQKGSLKMHSADVGRHGWEPLSRRERAVGPSK